mmetsp:Transcript_11509/g.38444  ORF Transcript_11509/g.38444 Transcript_11509/m.38444 type:complete len:231 (+) Transcript_11509:877-1569(+)
MPRTRFWTVIEARRLVAKTSRLAAFFTSRARRAHRALSAPWTRRAAASSRSRSRSAWAIKAIKASRRSRSMRWITKAALFRRSRSERRLFTMTRVRRFAARRCSSRAAASRTNARALTLKRMSAMTRRVAVPRATFSILVAHLARSSRFKRASLRRRAASMRPRRPRHKRWISRPARRLRFFSASCAALRIATRRRVPRARHAASIFVAAWTQMRWSRATLRTEASNLAK